MCNFSIHRRYFFFDLPKFLQLVGFCDSSKKAYAAILYARTVNENCCVDVRFTCGKARVTPLKEVTIPRLELVLAVLLSKLVDRIARDLNIEEANVFLFSDSFVVLSRIKTPIITQFKPFVIMELARY